MFWDVYCSLCDNAGESPNGVASKLGFSNATCTKWKKGSVPGGTSLSKIAEYFGVGTDYLLGKEKEPVTALDEVESAVIEILRGMTVQEKLDLIAYLKGKK